jgi:hypothetical protein
MWGQRVGLRPGAKGRLGVRLIYYVTQYWQPAPSGTRPPGPISDTIPRTSRTPGALRGQLVVSEEFFEPLPPDELEGWEQ